MPPEQLHSLAVPYPPYDAKRALLCKSVADFDHFEAVDFREFSPPDRALEDFHIAVVGVTKHILAARQEKVADSQPIYGIERVMEFAGRVGLHPFGKLSQVNRLTLFGQEITSPGTTSTLHRQSFIIPSNLSELDGTRGLHTSRTLPPIPKNLILESAAVHELTHLSGIPDIAYFIIDRKNPRNILNLMASALVLEDSGPESRGRYFEEGMATLCAFMYLWERLPSVAKDPRTEERRAPNGNSMQLPVRHSLYSNTYAYMAFGMERLIEFSPKIWDIFLRSRTYGASPSVVRQALRTELDKLDRNLFPVLDCTNIKNLSHVLTATAIIDEIVRKRVHK